MWHSSIKADHALLAHTASPDNIVCEQVTAVGKRRKEVTSQLCSWSESAATTPRAPCWPMSPAHGHNTTVPPWAFYQACMHAYITAHNALPAAGIYASCAQ